MHPTSGSTGRQIAPVNFSSGIQNSPINPFLQMIYPPTQKTLGLRKWDEFKGVPHKVH